MVIFTKVEFFRLNHQKIPTFVIAMKIFINDTEIDVRGSECSVASLLEEMKMNVTGCAVAINNAIVPFVKWNETVVKEGDKITLIRATQGG